MVRYALVIFLLLIPSRSWGLGDAEILLQKELKAETSKIAIEAVKLREIRLLEEIRTIIKEKGRVEEKRIRQAFGMVGAEIYDRGQERRGEMNDSLQSFVLRYNDSPSIAKVYLRLAELYYEQANEQFIRDIDDFERVADEHIGDPDFEEGEMPNIDYDPAIELYREFISFFPDHPYATEALYLYAFTLDENGQPDEAAEIFQKLIALDPDGYLAPESHFRLAEYLFLAAEFEDAEEQYLAVVRSKDPVFADKAQYKLGWTQYLLENYEASIRTFLALVDAADEVKDGSGQQLSMRKESLQYIAISFAEKGGLDALMKMLKDLGGRSYELEIYQSLGQVYFDMTQYPEAAATYNEIIKRYPENVQNPELKERIIQIAGNIGGMHQALEERKSYVQLFGPGSRWAQVHLPSRPDLVHEVEFKSEEFLYEYSTYFHAQSQKVKDQRGQQKFLGQAVSAYIEYIGRFPGSRRVTDVTFNLAEIRFEQKNWVAAGNAYRRLTQLILDPQDATFAEAAWNMVLSFRNALSLYEKDYPVEEYLRALTAGTTVVKKQLAGVSVRAKKGKSVRATDERGTRGAEKLRRASAKVQNLKERGGGESGKLVQLPGAVRDVVDSAFYYLQLYPLGEKTPSVLYSIGELFSKYNQHTAARGNYLKFLNRFPDNNFAMDAIKNIAGSYVSEGRYDELVHWGKQVLKTSLGTDTAIYMYFSGILSGAMFKDARKLEDNRKWLAANKVYEELRATYPESEYVDEAIQNAAINYQEASQWDRSNEAFRLFAAKYPDSEFAPKALFQIATNHEKFMDYSGAISAYEDVLLRFPETDQAKDGLYNSATLAAKLLLLEKAATLYLDYLQKYKGAKDEEDILFFAANSFYQLGNYEKTIDIYERFLKTAKEPKPRRLLQSYHELGQSSEKLGKLIAADEWQKKLIAFTEEHMNDPEPVNTLYAAELAFRYAMIEYKEYAGIKLRGSSAEMSKTLKKKLDLLPKINENYLGIIKFKHPLYASAALHMIGETFMSLADMLFDAPVPADLDEEEQDVYLEELAMQAEPIEEKALENWRRNLENAVRLGIVNEWVVKSRKKLESLSSNLARIKHQEEYVVSSSEFFYDFGSAEVTHPEYRIDGPSVQYNDLPAGSRERLVEKYVFARFFGTYHKQLLSEIAVPDLVFDYNGMKIRMDKLLAPRTK